jgi:fumarate hydratase subunit alpha
VPRSKRPVHAARIRDAVKDLALAAEFAIDELTLRSIAAAAAGESSELGAAIFREILDNASTADAQRRPLCQDTGLTIVWIELGCDVSVEGGCIRDAVDEGVRIAWREGGLRNSVVADPFDRRNTQDNTPAFIHLEETAGDRLRVSFLAKGGGCENQSYAEVLKPSQGRAGVVEYVVRSVAARAAFACPPLVVGVGLGGPVDHASWLAKKALFRPLGSAANDPETSALERELLDGINASGVGPMGLGGSVTALACHVERGPCHIASLPVGVCLNCHSHRVGSVEL